MSKKTSIYEEALADAKTVVDLAYEQAKNSILEQLDVPIRKLASKLMKEDGTFESKSKDEDELDDMLEDINDEDENEEDIDFDLDSDELDEEEDIDIDLEDSEEELDEEEDIDFDLEDSEEELDEEEDIDIDLEDSEEELDEEEDIDFDLEDSEEELDEEEDIDFDLDSDELDEEEDIDFDLDSDELDEEEDIDIDLEDEDSDTEEDIDIDLEDEDSDTEEELKKVTSENRRYKRKIAILENRIKTQDSTLKKYKTAIKLVKSNLNEAIIVNTKLASITNLFNSKKLSKTQKLKIIEKFDTATTLKEVKLISESLKKSKLLVEDNSSKITTGASRSERVLGKNKKILNESEHPLKNRYQQIAGIRKKEY